MAEYQVVINTSTGNLLRVGHCDFANDGSFDAATETVITPADLLQDPIIDRVGNTNVTHWDGTSFQTASRSLGTIKTEKIGVLKLEITGFLISRYAIPLQSSLNLLMNEANSKGWTNRAAEIQKGIDFLGQGLDEYYTRRDEVSAATTVSGVQAVVLDLDTLTAADPVLDLEDVKNITD